VGIQEAAFRAGACEGQVGSRGVGGLWGRRLFRGGVRHGDVGQRLSDSMKSRGVGPAW
jgi:hypothetical protein